MEQRRQPQRSTRHVSKCGACLSRDRRLSRLRGIPDGVNVLYLLLCYDGRATVHDAINTEELSKMRICWECSAVLLRIISFMRQASEVQTLLTQVNVEKSYSRLGYYYRTGYDSTVIEYETTELDTLHNLAESHTKNRCSINKSTNCDPTGNNDNDSIIIIKIKEKHPDLTSMIPDSCTIIPGFHTYEPRTLHKEECTVIPLTSDRSTVTPLTLEKLKETALTLDQCQVTPQTSDQCNVTPETMDHDSVSPHIDTSIIDLTSESETENYDDGNTKRRRSCRQQLVKDISQPPKGCRQNSKEKRYTRKTKNERKNALTLHRLARRLTAHKQCLVCEYNKLFNSNRQFEQHNSFHKKSEIKCGEKAHLVKHLASHTGLNPNHSGLERSAHKLRVAQFAHSKNHSFTCDICQKKFREKTHLVKHLQTVHYDLSPVVMLTPLFDNLADSTTTNRSLIYTSENDNFDVTMVEAAQFTSTGTNDGAIKEKHPEFTSVIPDSCIITPGFNTSIPRSLHGNECTVIPLTSDKKTKRNHNNDDVNKNEGTVAMEEITTPTKGDSSTGSDYDKIKEELDFIYTTPEPSTIAAPALYDPLTLLTMCTVTPMTDNDTDDINIFVCDICQKSFKEKAHLVKHLASHRGINSHQDLNNCNKPFSAQLRAAQLANTKNHSFVCDICKKTFREKDNLGKHLQTVHYDLSPVVVLTPLFDNLADSLTNRSSIYTSKNDNHSDDSVVEAAHFTSTSTNDENRDHSARFTSTGTNDGKVKEKYPDLSSVIPDSCAITPGFHIYNPSSLQLPECTVIPLASDRSTVTPLILDQCESNPLTSDQCSVTLRTMDHGSVSPHIGTSIIDLTSESDTENYKDFNTNEGTVEITLPPKGCNSTRSDNDSITEELPDFVSSAEPCALPTPDLCDSTDPPLISDQCNALDPWIEWNVTMDHGYATKVNNSKPESETENHNDDDLMPDESSMSDSSATTNDRNVLIPSIDESENHDHSNLSVVETVSFTSTGTSDARCKTKEHQDFTSMIRIPDSCTLIRGFHSYERRSLHKEECTVIPLTTDQSSVTPLTLEKLKVTALTLDQPKVTPLTSDQCSVTSLTLDECSLTPLTLNQCSVNLHTDTSTIDVKSEAETEHDYDTNECTVAMEEITLPTKIYSFTGTDGDEIKEELPNFTSATPEPPDLCDPLTQCNVTSDQCNSLTIDHCCSTLHKEIASINAKPESETHNGDTLVSESSVSVKASALDESSAFIEEINPPPEKIEEYPKLCSQNRELDSEKKCFICDLCGKNVLSLNRLAKHISAHKQCLVCDKLFDSKRQFEAHNIRFHKTKLSEIKCGMIKVYPKVCFQNQCFICDLCGKKVHSLNRLAKHVSAHKQCLVCDKLFCTKREFDTHNKRFHNTKRNEIKCDSCRKHFYSRQQLATHISAHKQCLVCDKLLVGEAALKRHIKYFHSTKESNKEKRKILLCDICSREFTCEKRLACHKLHHIRNKTRKLKVKILCNICNQWFSSELFLAWHKMTTHKSLTCEPCNRDFPNPSQLKYHLQMVHTEKRFMCDQCGKTFAIDANRRKHAETHGVEKFQCDICKRTFKRKQYIISHLNLIHHRSHERKQFICDICHQSFKKKSYIVQHFISSHSNINPYVNKCTKRYAEKQRVEHFPRRKIRSCVCDICQTKFHEKTYLVKHLQTVHYDLFPHVATIGPPKKT